MTTIKLTKPLTVGDTTYSEFTFREAKTGDLMAADIIKGETSKIIAILASMADVPLNVFREVPMRDMTRIMSETAALMGEPGPVTTGD